MYNVPERERGGEEGMEGKKGEKEREKAQPGTRHKNVTRIND